MTSHVLIIKVCQEISGHEYWFLQHGWEQYHMNEYVKLASSKYCETCQFKSYFTFVIIKER